MLSNKKSKKLLILFIVFCLIFTVFPSDILAHNVTIKKSTGTNENISPDEKPKVSVLKENTTNLEKIQKTKNKYNSFSNNSVNSVKDVSLIKNQVKIFINTLISFLLLRTQSTNSINFVTNYDGLEKKTDLNLFRTVRVDVDGEGSDDISASLFPYLSIEKGFTFSFNFRLSIKKLNRNSIDDEKKSLKAYAEIIFPGLLNAAWKNDSVGFGYRSPESQEVPDSCKVTYKFIPNILKKDQKPVHKVLMENNFLNGDYNLALFYMHSKTTGGTLDEKISWDILYNQMVKKMEITTGRYNEFTGFYLDLDLFGENSMVTIRHSKTENGTTSDIGLLSINGFSSFSFAIKLTPLSSGGGLVEYKRISSQNVEISLFKPNSGSYFYIKNLPEHIKFSWIPELVGGIKLDTFNDNINKVGWRNALEPSDATADVYFSNLPSIARVNWSIRPIKNKNISLDIYSDTKGCKAHVSTDNFFNKNLVIVATLRSLKNINSSLFWNFEDHLFRVDRCNIDLDLTFSIANRETENWFAFSGGIKRTISSPFEIYFGEFLDKQTTITFAGKSLELRNVHAQLYLEQYGTFSLDINDLTKEKYGSITTGFSVFKNGNILTINCTIQITNGVEMHGVVIGYDDFSYPVGDIEEANNATHTFSFTLENANVIWDVAPDFSWGDIVISGGISLSFNSNYTRDGKTYGRIKGMVYFTTEDQVLNISWRTVNGSKVFNIDGGGVLGLSGFEFWFEDLFDIRIPEIMGRFKINTAEGTGEILLFVNQTSGSFNFEIEDIRIVGLLNFTFMGNIDAYFYGEVSGIIKITWTDLGFFIDGFAEGGVQGELTLQDIDFTYYSKSQSFFVYLYELAIQGDMSFDISFTDKDGFIDLNGASLIIQGLSVQIYGTSTCLIMSLGFLDAQIEGKIWFTNESISLEDMALEVTMDNLRANIRGSGMYSINHMYIDIDNIDTGDILIKRNGGNSFEFRFAATIKRIELDGINVYDTNSNLILRTDFGIEGPIRIITDTALSIIQICIPESGSVSLNNFYANMNNGETVIQFHKVGVSGSGRIYLKRGGPEGISLIDVDSASLDYISIVGLHLESASQDIKVEGSAYFSGPVHFEIYLIPHAIESSLELEIKVYEGSFKIENFEVSYAGFLVACKLLEIGFDGSGSVHLGRAKEPGGYSDQYYNIEASASINYFELKEFFVATTIKTFFVEGRFDCSATGPVTMSMVALSNDPAHIEVELDSGSFTINSLLVYINNGEFYGEWESLVISGSFLLELIVGNEDENGDLIDNAIDISLQGSGTISLIKALIVGKLNDNVEVEFYVESIGLTISGNATSIDVVVEMVNNKPKILSLESLNAGGSLGIDIEDLTVKNLNLGTQQFVLEVENLDLTISGSGKFNIYTETNEADVQEFYLDASLSGPGSINIGFMKAFIPGILIEVENCNIGGPTTLHLNAHGSSLHDFEVVVGCDSGWDVGRFKIEGLVEFMNFIGVGNLSLGFDGSLADQEGDFILDLDGSWEWDKIGILIHDIMPDVPYLDIEQGRYNGNMQVRIDFAIIMLIFGNPFPLNSKGIIVDVYEETSISGIKISSDDYGFLEWLIGLAPETIEPGHFQFGWNISQSSSEISIFIDTDNIWRTLPLIILNWFQVDLEVLSQDTTITWRKNESFWEKISIDPPGSIQIHGSISIFLNGEWVDLPLFEGGPNDDIIVDAGGPYYGTPNIPINFVGSTSDGDPPCTYDWSFGDGHFASGKNVYHTYTNTSSKTYTVNLMVTDNTGKKGSDTTQAIISGNEPPVAEFTWWPDCYISEGEEMEFYGYPSNDPDGSIGKYEWNFGDGSSIEEGINPQHIYLNPGDFDVTLTVTDDLGATDSETKTITVHDMDPANTPPDACVHYLEQEPPYGWAIKDDYAVNNQISVSGDTSNWYKFLAYPTWGQPGQNTDDRDGYIRHYKWEIYKSNGDLDSTGWNRLDCYEEIPDTSDIFGAMNFPPGPNSVTLTVKDNEQGQSSATINLDVQGSGGVDYPIADAGEDQYVDIGDTVSFDGTGSYHPDDNLSIVRYDWKFCSECSWENEIGPNPDHVYNQKGKYTVTLRVEDEEGKIDYDSALVYVGFEPENKPPLTPGRPNGPDSGDVDNTYDFSASTTDPDGDNLWYLWSFDSPYYSPVWDGPYSSGSPCLKSYPFSQEGTYEIKVKAKDEHGEESGWSPIKTITISDVNYPPDKPSVEHSGDGTGKFGVPQIFTATASDPDGDPLKYKWEWQCLVGTQKSGWMNTPNTQINWHVGITPFYRWVRVKVKETGLFGKESEWSDKFTIEIVSCLSGDTNITMAGGTDKLIKDIKKGDIVKSFDYVNDSIVESKVTKLFSFDKYQIKSYLVINNDLKITPDHVVYINGNWQLAGTIKVGDILLNQKNREIIVNSVKKVEQQIPTYNLKLDGFQAYFANGILVHT